MENNAQIIRSVGCGTKLYRYRDQYWSASALARSPYNTQRLTRQALSYRIDHLGMDVEIALTLPKTVAGRRKATEDPREKLKETVEWISAHIELMAENGWTMTGRQPEVVDL